MARVPYIDAKDLAPEERGILGEHPINIRRALANSPNAARQNGALAMHIRNASRLNPRLRELAILQVGYTARSPYEFAHHVEIAKQAGVSDDDVRAIALESKGSASALDPLSRAVLAAAREMTIAGAVTDATWAALAKGLGNEELVELVIAIAFYNSTVRILASLKVDLEPEYRHYLEAFPLPPA